jgi:hypothetical protein
MSLMDEIKAQRWDDHRFYHQSYINQALHLFSAICFIGSYVLLPINLVAAGYLGGLVALWSRQIGHFFFEKTDYDTINDISFEGKEAIKVGFNLQRKVFLFAAWITGPVALAIPVVAEKVSLLTGTVNYIDNVSYVWIATGVTGFFARTIYLIIFRSPQTGLAWFSKILSDPFHDIYMYHKAPLHLLRGERFDPIVHHPRDA